MVNPILEPPAEQPTTVMLRNTGTRVYVGSVYIAPGAAVAVPADEAAFMLEHFKADAYGRGPFEIVED
jgi:hypothetical protein